MSNKKIIFLIIGVSVLAGIIYLVTKFQQSDKKVADYVVPKLKLAQMQITRLTAERVDMKMNMLIDNPAPVGLLIDSLFYRISIAGLEVARTTYPDSLRLKANDSTKVSLPLSVYYNKLKGVVDSLEKTGQDSALYTVNATIFSDTKLIPKDKFNLKLEKKLPIIFYPKIKIKDIDVSDLKLKGATMYVEALVENRNVFPMGFKDLDYSVKIDNNEAVEGHKPGTVQIPAKGSANISIPVELTFKEMGKNLIDLIRKGDDVSYDFKLRTELVSDKHVIENSKINMSASGKLGTVVDAVKEQSKK